MSYLFIAKIVAIALAAAALAWGVHLVLEHFREQGRQEQLAKDQPIIDQLKADKATLEQNEATLKAEIANLNASVQGWQDQAKASKAQAQVAIARAQAQAKAYEATIGQLQTRIAAAPIPDFAEACRQADAIIANLLAGSRP